MILKDLIELKKKIENKMATIEDLATIVRYLLIKEIESYDNSESDKSISIDYLFGEFGKNI